MAHRHIVAIDRIGCRLPRFLRLYMGGDLVAEGSDLYWWHPLISGDPETVHIAGISGRGRIISEDDAGDLEDHVVEWVDTIPPQAKKKPRR